MTNSTPMMNTASLSLVIPYETAKMPNTQRQMIRAFSIIANDGFDVKPTILKKIVKNINEEDQVIVDNIQNYKSNKKKRILSKNSCKVIKLAMKFTTKLGGTSRLGDIYGFTEAGKSGTAERSIGGKYDKDKNRMD